MAHRGWKDIANCTVSSDAPKLPLRHSSLSNDDYRFRVVPSTSKLLIVLQWHGSVWMLVCTCFRDESTKASDSANAKHESQLRTYSLQSPSMSFGM